MEPGERRMVTRPGNATRRPGAVLQASRRPKEVIEEEKQEKRARQLAKEKTRLAEEAREAAGEEHLAQLEAEAAAVATVEQNQYPRRVQRAKGSLPRKVNNPTNKGIKRRAAEQELTAQAGLPATGLDHPPEDVSGKTPTKRGLPAPVVKTSQVPAQSGQASPETETEEVTPTRPAKRVKGLLRRTETAIDFTVEKMSASKHTLLEGDNLIHFTESEAAEEEKMEVDEENDGEMPCPTSRRNNNEDDSELTNEEEEENQAFKTSLTKKAKNLKTVFVEPSDSDEIEEVEEVPTKQRQKRKNGGPATKGKERAKEYDAWAIANTKATSHVQLASSRPAPTTGRKNEQRRLIISHDQLASPPPSVAFTVVPRTTASNTDVVTKDVTSTTAPLPKTKKKKTTPEIAEEGEQAEGVAGGMRSDEDDTLDRQMALSSPMKGSDLRKSLKQDLKIKAEEDIKPPIRKPKPTFGSLPRGANDDDAWTQIAIPAYFNEFLGGDNAWIYKEEQFKKLLKIVFDHVYGNRLSLDINKGSVAYEILYQRTCQHRNSFGTKALDVTWAYYRTKVNGKADLAQGGEEIGQWARNFLDRKDFLYKGSEKAKPKRSGPMEHPLILQTLTAHFSVNTMGRALPGGLMIRKPYCSLALAATAVERALTLFSRQVVEKKASGGKKAFKLSVVRTLNPDTGTLSTVENDFSKDNWADATMEYLRGIKNFDDDRFDRILNEAHRLSRSGGKYQEPDKSAAAAGSTKSFRESLVSEGESSGEEQ